MLQGRLIHPDLRIEDAIDSGLKPSGIFVSDLARRIRERSLRNRSPFEKACRPHRRAGSLTCGPSGRLDLNQRPLPPQGSALPGCATSRDKKSTRDATIRVEYCQQLLQVVFYHPDCAARSRRHSLICVRCGHLRRRQIGFARLDRFIRR